MKTDKEYLKILISRNFLLLTIENTMISARNTENNVFSEFAEDF